MINFMFIRDTITGKTVLILQQEPGGDYTLIKDETDVSEVRRRSLGKTIRSWVKEVKHDSGG